MNGSAIGNTTSQLGTVGADGINLHTLSDLQSCNLVHCNALTNSNIQWKNQSMINSDDPCKGGTLSITEKITQFVNSQSRKT
jgi:hypothetical protein